MIGQTPPFSRTGHVSSLSTTNGVALHLDGVTKRFGDFTAVDSLSMTVPSGYICGFLGPNGSGKTTSYEPGSALPAASSYNK